MLLTNMGQHPSLPPLQPKPANGVAVIATTVVIVIGIDINIIIIIITIIIIIIINATNSIIITIILFLIITVIFSNHSGQNDGSMQPLKTTCSMARLKILLTHREKPQRHNQGPPTQPAPGSLGHFTLAHLKLLAHLELCRLT